MSSRSSKILASRAGFVLVCECVGLGSHAPCSQRANLSYTVEVGFELITCRICVFYLKERFLVDWMKGMSTGSHVEVDNFTRERLPTVYRVKTTRSISLGGVQRHCRDCFFGAIKRTLNFPFGTDFVVSAIHQLVAAYASCAC